MANASAAASHAHSLDAARADAAEAQEHFAAFKCEAAKDAAAAAEKYDALKVAKGLSDARAESGVSEGGWVGGGGDVLLMIALMLMLMPMPMLMVVTTMFLLPPPTPAVHPTPQRR